MPLPNRGVSGTWSSLKSQVIRHMNSKLLPDVMKQSRHSGLLCSGGRNLEPDLINRDFRYLCHPRTIDNESNFAGIALGG